MTTGNPWTTHGTRSVYKNPWLHLREDRVTRPDGSDGLYAYIETRVATAAAAMTPEREVYLVGQYRYPTKVYSWEVAEGGAEDGEHALEAAKRELREETGLTARTWTQLGGEVHLSNCISAERAYMFLAEDLEHGPASPDATEILRVRSVPLADCLAMIDAGEIVDAFTVMTLLQLDRYLRTHRS
jgi:8-oxo-dGTP pyrophosphatase MutT (NUDIX family)